MIKIFRKTLIFGLFILTTFGYLSASPNGGEPHNGAVCFEMGASVGYYFFKKKVIRYSAFHPFNPPTKLVKTLVGDYVVTGSLVNWYDKANRINYSYDKEKHRLAVNGKWSNAAHCEEKSLGELKLFFQPILEKNGLKHRKDNQN